MQYLGEMPWIYRATAIKPDPVLIMQGDVNCKATGKDAAVPFRTSRDVLLESGMRTKEAVRCHFGFMGTPWRVADCRSGALPAFRFMRGIARLPLAFTTGEDNT